MNPEARRRDPTVQLKDLQAHIPKLKRAGEGNKGDSYRYEGEAGMIGFRHSYHHGGGQYIIYECNAGCQEMNPTKECRFVKHCYLLARFACRGRQESTFMEDLAARLRVKASVNTSDMVHDVVVAAMINTGMEPLAAREFNSIL